MLGKFESRHNNDAEGNPSGGLSTGVGVSISWQRGPLGQGHERKEPNGGIR